MEKQLWLARKYNFRISNRHLVLRKRINESQRHVFMKALTVALYEGQYPGLMVDVPIGDRYKPDVVKVDSEGKPVFWAECGALSRKKIRRILRKYRNAHFVFVKRMRRFREFVKLVKKEAAGLRRKAPVELLGLPDDVEGFFDESGVVTISRADCESVTL